LTDFSEVSTAAPQLFTYLGPATSAAANFVTGGAQFTTMNSDAITSGGATASLYGTEINQDIANGQNLLSALSSISSADPSSSTNSWVSALSSKVVSELNILCGMSTAAANHDGASFSAGANTLQNWLTTNSAGLDSGLDSFEGWVGSLGASNADQYAASGASAAPMSTASAEAFVSYLKTMVQQNPDLAKNPEIGSLLNEQNNLQSFGTTMASIVSNTMKQLAASADQMAKQATPSAGGAGDAA
jgi:hypothetical protein